MWIVIKYKKKEINFLKNKIKNKTFIIGEFDYINFKKN
jgi:hypothetical protein